jgi:hypothetical protein
MSARLVYQWGWIAPGATVGIYNHGWGNHEAISWSGIVYALSGDAYYPLGKIDVVRGATSRHVDGTIAHEVYVTNKAPNNPCAVDMLAIVESY